MCARDLAALLTRSWCAAGTVAVLSAGTADESVAEECRVIADYMGCYTFKLPDVSVDGLHRILHNLPGLAPPCHAHQQHEPHSPLHVSYLRRHRTKTAP